MTFKNLTLLFLLLSVGKLPEETLAADLAAELLPASTVFFAEIQNPAQSLDAFLEHPYFANLQKLKPYEELTRSPQYLQGMAALRIVEFQLGMTWRDVVRGLTAGGVSVAFDGQTQGLAILFKAESEESLNKIRDKVIKLARQDAKNKGDTDPYTIKQYRGIDAYTTKEGGFLTFKNWLVVGNHSELAQQLVDALLDGRADSLASNPEFQTAQSKFASTSIAWGFLNFEPLRSAPDKGLQKLFSGQADDPGGEIILGGVLEGIKSASHVAASLSAQDQGLVLSLQLPHLPTSISLPREHYLGPQGLGVAAPLLDVPNLLFGLSAYRNLSKMWLHAGDLFNEKVNDGLAQADSNLSTFFSGKDFAEDILGVVSPQIQILAVRQNYAEDRPIPAIKIPAFALVTEMKHPETTTREFRRIYQSFIGFFNVIGAMNGQPQFELDFETLPTGQLISATPLPLAGEETQTQAKINFNFSPTLAFAGNRLILSSATGLARSLTEVPLPLPPTAETGVENSETTSTTTTTEGRHNSKLNTYLRMNIPELQRSLEENQSHLIAQDMLKKGHTHDEAEKQIGMVLELLKLFDSANLKLSTTSSTMDLNIGIQLSE